MFYCANSLGEHPNFLKRLWKASLALGLAKLYLFGKPLGSSECHIQFPLFPENPHSLISPVSTVWLQVHVKLIQNSGQDKSHFDVSETTPGQSLLVKVRSELKHLLAPYTDSRPDRKRLPNFLIVVCISGIVKPTLRDKFSGVAEVLLRVIACPVIDRYHGLVLVLAAIELKWI